MTDRSGNGIGDVRLVGFVVYNRSNNRFLVENRPNDASIYAGEIRVLGGHINDGETPVDTAHREIAEEVGVLPTDLSYLCRAVDAVDGRLIELYMFGFSDWEGVLKNMENKKLYWVRPETKRLNPLDRWAMKLYEDLITNHEKTDMAEYR